MKKSFLPGARRFCYGALGLMFFLTLPVTQPMAQMAGQPPIGPAGQMPASASGLLFYLSGDHGFRADYAAGRAEPNFQSGVSIVPGGFRGSAIHCDDGRQQFSYWAPGNIYAQRGTLSFAWRGAQPFTQTEFPIFRVGYADHSSWDMVWLRIDYNGHGFDAFVTDANLARVRVSYAMPKLPAPEEWTHFALTWDETEGIRFYINGQKVAENKMIAVLNTGLDQFGPHSRIISPWQVQSAYNFIRGGEIDEIRIYDQALADPQIAVLARGDAPEVKPFMRNPSEKRWQDEWALRYGWNRPGDLPPYLADNETVIRKVQTNNVYDEKRWWWKGTDGIRETTWPGVYNRSRLPGRNDYFQLPDWDCYATSGKQVRFLMPDEPWNYVEIAGAAFGSLAVSSNAESTEAAQFSTRPANQEKTFHKTASPVTGKTLVFTNDEQETPIGELTAYYIHPGKAPAGVATLSYALTSHGSRNNENIFDIEQYIAGRYPVDERSVMLATPGSGGGRAGRRGEMPYGAAGGQAPRRAVPTDHMPLVHVIIPSDFRTAGLVYEENVPLMARGSSYTWRNMKGGLDGIRITLPALDVQPTMDGYFPINIQVKDPIWPLRNMFDFTFSVKPDEERTLYLDLRDRILPDDKPLYLTLAGSGLDFSSVDLEGARIDLIFKSLDEAKKEHVADRFTQVRDTYAMIVEEGTNSKRLNKYNQFEADMGDLLRVEPNHYPGYNYWYIYNSEQVKPTVEPLVVPAGVPRWAFLQLENLKRHKNMVEYFIDQRQIASGQFGGGISDDTDLGHWFPPLAYMGVMPDKIKNSIEMLTQAIYDEGTITDGLPTIQTDGLHTFEEGGNTVCQMNVMAIGDPKQVERMMEIARATNEKILGVNAAGHYHFRSDYFSATKIADQGPWVWSSTREYMHLLPSIYMGEFYGNEAARQAVIRVADGMLAHATVDAQGNININSEINFLTDEDRASGLGNSTPLFWAAYRWTGNEKYLRPLLNGNYGNLSSINSNALDIANLRQKVGPTILQMAERGSQSDPVRYYAWQLTGDKRYLEALYADQIYDATVREYINTEGSIWIDRLVLAHDEMQRSRLGGMVMNRSMFYAGQTVTWRFARDEQAEKVAILIPTSNTRELQIELFNTDNVPVEVDMRGWDLLNGKWELTQTTTVDTDRTPANTTSAKSRVDFGRNEIITLTLAPGKTTLISMKLVGSGTDVRRRPELGIGADDITAGKERITVRVHNLGSVASTPTTVALVDADGKVLSSVKLPAIAAPTDLRPKFTDVVLSVPAGIDWDFYGIKVDPDDRLKEITKENNTCYFVNSVSIPDAFVSDVPASSPF